LTDPKIPPKPEDFGLDPDDARLLSGAEGERASFGIPRRLSPGVNWTVGLAGGIPLGLWSFWGVVERIPQKVVGVSVGILAGIVVFQLAVFTVPLMIDLAMHALALGADEIAQKFSDKARRRIAYRRARRQYLADLVNGEN